MTNDPLSIIDLSQKSSAAQSDNEETARVFASGLNAIEKGGLLLRTLAPSRSIIAGPLEHSRHLSETEFSIDNRKLGAIDVVVRFPPSR